jgi:two-component system sensor histidine kinase PilS (NtrC family)
VTLAGYSVASLALLVLVRRSRSMKRISQLSIGIDLAAVSVLTVLSGGTDSQLVPIYMLIIVGAAVLLSPVSGMTAAIVSVSLLSLTYLGQTVGWVARCSEVNDAQGGVFRFVAVVSFLVLTAFLAAYLALNSSRLKFLNVEILESMNAGVAIVDLDANVQYLNSMGCRLLGQNPLAVRGAAVDRVFPGPAGAAIRSTLKTGVPASRMEVTLKTDQGADTPAGITTSVLSDRRRHIWGVAASFSDLSEVKRIEERLRHADRMETIAHSAAGMGHELRNPLACIRGGVDLLTEILPVGGEVAEVMELVARETQRLSTIVESFLDVSRVSSPVCAEHTFGEIWSEVESVLHAKFGGVLLTKVRLVLTPGSEEVVCWADLGQIRQVLINLTQNALEALADVGSIRVSCQYRRVDETAASTAGVEVFVTDDGPGVPRGFENRVFEPFYTSKARGTGLGLAVVKRIIEGHGGEVRLLTTLGPGTTFHFWLPPKGCGG